MTDQRTPQQGPPLEQLRAALPYLLALLILVTLVFPLIRGPGATEISYTEFKRRVALGQVAEVIFRDSEIVGELHKAQPIGAGGAQSQRFVTRVPALGDNELLPALERQNVQVRVKEGGRGSPFLSLLLWLLPDDIRQATGLARSMVARWGMSEAIGPVDLRDSEEHPFLGREIAQPRRFSESSAQAVDQAVRSLLNEAEERARAVLQEHSAGLDRVASALEEEEDLDRERIEALLGPRRQAGSPAPEERAALH